MHITIIIKKLVKKKERKKKEKETKEKHNRTNVWALGFGAGLLTRRRFASGRSCDRPTRLRFSVVFRGPRANAELVPKFHVALHASYAVLPMVTVEISPYTHVPLTSGWITLFMGEKKESKCQTKKLKI
jgi:hypothetical protein